MYVDEGMDFRTVMQHGREEDEDVTGYERRLEILLGGTRQPRERERRMKMFDTEFVEADSPDAEFSRLGTIRGVMA
jgi:hypothetical protein